MKLEKKVQKLVLTGVFAALLAVLSQISFPLPTGVPVTLQTFAVALCGYVLGPKLGVVSVLVYLALGAAGLPVFSEFSAGIGVFAGMTGGYLWGFLFMVFLCGLGVKFEKRLPAIGLGVSGLAVCHLCGAVQFSLVTATPPLQAFLLASVPYLVKDVVSVVLARLVAEAISYALRKERISG